MCGIAGFIDFNNGSDKSILTKMTDALTHRGPDASGYYCVGNDRFTIGLGHRRLSIIDLSPLGIQPMQISDGKYRITFNGEIYNYKEIKEELTGKGHNFISSSDTEVILVAFKEWGHQAIHKFIGMFAFALYDEEKQKLFLYRDRPGIKPLNYYWHNGILLFASELKSFFEHPAFIPEIDNNSVYHFLQYGYVPAPDSIFRHSYKVEPGYYLEVDLKNKTISSHKYWSAYDYYNKPILAISEDEALTELEQRLKRACEYRMVSDVPVGIFLSGGYDSSMITALLQKGRTEKIKTFTIGFNEQKYNEAEFAKGVANYLGTDHYEYYCSDQEAKNIIPELPFYFDEPFGDTSAIPTILVSRFARQQVKVALSADAGDEVFAGYVKYLAALRFSKINSGIPKSLKKPASFFLGKIPEFVLKTIFKDKDVSKENISKYKKFISKGSGALEIMEYANYSATPETVAEFFTDSVPTCTDFFHKEELNKNVDDLHKMQAVDFMACLSNDILTKVDRSTMSTSLEGREPLLDHNIIEWVATLPSEFKIQQGTSKYLFRKLVHKHIPASLMDRPKMGFSIPLVDWLRHDLKELFEYYLSDRCLSWHGLFKIEKIRSVLQQYYKGSNNRFTLLWYLLTFQMWYEQWMLSANKRNILIPKEKHI